MVPPRRPVIDIIGQLKFEEDIAKNIKNDETRKNVLEALNNIINYIRYSCSPRDVIPEDGLIIHAHKDKLELKASKEPVNINLYRCDDHFYTYMGETL